MTSRARGAVLAAPAAARLPDYLSAHKRAHKPPTAPYGPLARQAHDDDRPNNPDAV